MSEEETKENEQVLWILYGVILAFAVQVMYDFVGLETNQTVKVLVGAITTLILLGVVQWLLSWTKRKKMILAKPKEKS